MRDDSDDVLVRRVLAGDTQAYAGLVERYRVRLGRYAARMLGNQADAEDALQDTFIRAYRSLKRCDPDRFRFWVFGILINRCRTHAAQRAKRQSVVISGDSAVANAQTLPRVDDEHGLRKLIAAALAQLPRDQREAFLLKHVEDLSYEEMEELTGVRAPALKMRVFRAREALRRSLQEKVLD